MSKITTMLDESSLTEEDPDANSSNKTEETAKQNDVFVFCLNSQKQKTEPTKLAKSLRDDSPQRHVKASCFTKSIKTSFYKNEHCRIFKCSC